MQGPGRMGNVLGRCGTHESFFSHSKALDTVLEYSQVAVGTAKYYELTSRVLGGWALGQCGTHESWFSHDRALDTVLGYSQLAVGTAYYYDMNSRALKG